MPNLFQKFDGGAFNSRVHVYPSAIQIIGPGSGFVIAYFDFPDFDSLGEFDINATFSFRPKNAGYYLIQAQLGFYLPTPPTPITAYIQKNGTIDVAGAAVMPQVNNCTLTIPAISYLTVGDYIQVIISRNSVDYIHVYPYGLTNLSIHRLS